MAACIPRAWPWGAVRGTAPLWRRLETAQVGARGAAPRQRPPAARILRSAVGGSARRAATSPRARAPRGAPLPTPSRRRRPVARAARAARSAARERPGRHSTRGWAGRERAAGLDVLPGAVTAASAPVLRPPPTAPHAQTRPPDPRAVCSGRPRAESAGCPPPRAARRRSTARSLPPACRARGARARDGGVLRLATAGYTDAWALALSLIHI